VVAGESGIHANDKTWGKRIMKITIEVEVGDWVKVLDGREDAFLIVEDQPCFLTGLPFIEGKHAAQVRFKIDKPKDKTGERIFYGELYIKMKDVKVPPQQ